MKIHAVYNEAGVIEAAIEIDEEAEHKSGIKMRPRAKDGRKSGDFSVPAEHAALHFTEVCRTLKVDVKAASPVLVKHSG